MWLRGLLLKIKFSVRQWIYTWSSREKLETEAHILGLNDVSQGEFSGRKEVKEET